MGFRVSHCLSHNFFLPWTPRLLPGKYEKEETESCYIPLIIHPSGFHRGAWHILRTEDNSHSEKIL